MLVGGGFACGDQQRRRAGRQCGFPEKNRFVKGAAARDLKAPLTTKSRGDAAEDAALAYLQRQGLRLVQRNFKTPGRGGGEVDLIMREPDGTLVFVEVRQRAAGSRGGAGGSITAIKQRRIVLGCAALFAATGISSSMPF